MTRFLFFFTFFFFQSVFAVEYKLAVCAIFQNEAPYLKEWIEFHKLQGVQHFYLFNNLSEDDPKSILADYIKKNEVTLIDWPERGQVYAQYTAYDHCLSLVRQKVKWLAYIDIDEFLFTTSGEPLNEYLKKFEKIEGVAGLCVNWQMFGTSGINTLAPKELIIEKLLLKAPSKYIENESVKTIVKPKLTVRCKNPHSFVYKNHFFAVDATLKKIEGPINSTIPVEEIRINHYFCKTQNFAYSEKLKRIMKLSHCSEEAARERIDLFDQNCSLEEDLTILIHREKLRKVMGF